MYTMWSPDTCKCKVLLDKEGNAVGFQIQCDMHKDKKPDDVIEDNRNKNKGVNLIAKEMKIEHSKILFRRDGNNNYIFSLAQDVPIDQPMTDRLNKVLAAQDLAFRIE